MIESNLGVRSEGSLGSIPHSFSVRLHVANMGVQTQRCIHISYLSWMHSLISVCYLYLNFTIPMLPVSLDCHVLSVLRFSLMFICTLSSSMVGFLISLLAKVYFVNRIDRERNRFKHKHITHLPIARVPHVYWVPFHLDFLIDLSKLHSIGNNLI
jgi:hypothetical protein